MNEFRGTKYFLSNFYNCKIKYEGILYPSVENAYQASKTLDFEERKQFIHITPEQARQLGKQLKLRKDHCNLKLRIMKELLQIKFNNKELKLKLLSTGDEWLEEKNKNTYWGTCNGIGENNLGKLLMNIRNKHKITEDIRNEIEHIIEKYLKHKGITTAQDLYYLYKPNVNIIDIIKNKYFINLNGKSNDNTNELIEINKQLKELYVDIYDEYKCEYVNQIEVLNWKRYSLYKNNVEFFYEKKNKKSEKVENVKKNKKSDKISNIVKNEKIDNANKLNNVEFFYEKKNEKKINTIICNDNNNINKMSEYNYELTKVFEEKLGTFFKWADNFYSLFEKDTNSKKNWDFDIIDEYKEPYRNKMEKYLENVLQKYNIRDSDGDLITTEKDIIIKFKDETEKNKKNKKSEKVEKVEKVKKIKKSDKISNIDKNEKIDNATKLNNVELNKNSLKCSNLDLYELDNDIDDSKCKYLMKLYFSRNELIPIFGDLIKYNGKFEDIKFMYKFSMNNNKYVIYTYSENREDDLWLLGGYITDQNEHTYQIIELIHFIEKHSRVKRIKKLNIETKESLINIENSIKSFNKKLSDNEISEDEMSEHEMSEDEMSDNEMSNDEMSDNEMSNNEMSDKEIDNQNFDNNVDDKLQKIFNNLKV